MWSLQTWLNGAKWKHIDIGTFANRHSSRASMYIGPNLNLEKPIGANLVSSDLGRKFVNSLSISTIISMPEYLIQEVERWVT